MVAGVVHLRPQEVVLEGMLSGWRAQQTSRGVKTGTMVAREQTVRRFLAFTNEFPWAWMPAHLDEWSASLLGERRLAASTVRAYQCELRLFSEYLIDPRYG